jgi:hypothetical protein
MARRKTRPLPVRKILALTPKEIEKLSPKKLQAYTTILNSAANKRVKRAQKLGTKSAVIEKAIEGGRFKTTRITKGTDPVKAKAITYSEFMRARDFLTKQTSATRGVKKQQRKVKKEFIKKTKMIAGDIFKDQPLTDTEINDLVWTQVDKMAESRAMTKEDRYRAAETAYEAVTSKDIRSKDELFKYMEEKREEIYIQSVENSDDVGDDEINELFKNFDGI